MSVPKTFTTPNKTTEDQSLEITLRPQTLGEFIGQEKIKENLSILIEAAQKRKEPVEHIMLCGAAGLGKTTLAYIIAKEMGAGIKTTTGPSIEKMGDLASILTNLAPGDILFIDECHRLNKTIEEVLYPAMEDFKLDIIIGKGPSARTLQLDLPRFTLVAATTRPGLISSPLRSRFGSHIRLDLYEIPDIEKIIQRSGRILKAEPELDSAKIIARSSRFTPRVANRLLKRVRDFSQVRGNGEMTVQITKKALAMLEIDELGLEPIDRQIIEIMAKKFDGGPTGLQSLSAALNEEIDTIQDVYEPYLLRLGFLARTPRGRVLTPAAYQHLGLEAPKGNQLRFIQQ